MQVNGQVIAGNYRVEDTDKLPDKTYGRSIDSNLLLFKRTKKTNEDKNAIRSIRENIVSAYRPAFECIWNNMYIRQGALNGNAEVYVAIDESFSCTIAESVSAEVAKVASFAGTLIKQPTLSPVNRKSIIDVDETIGIANTVLDRFFYENIDRFTGAFASSLKSGINFVHIDARLTTEDVITATQLSPYRCMWDTTKKAQDIHKGSFFLIEEFISQNDIRSIYGNEEADLAMKSRVDQIDTFPLREIRTILDSNRETIREGSKITITKKTHNLRYQIANEVAAEQHKVTTIYVRTKKEALDGASVKTFRNVVEKFVYINNKLVETSEMNISYIPVVAFSPMEDVAYTAIKERYQSLYDCIKGELLQLAIVQSSMSTCLLNSANNPIFIRDEALPAVHRNKESIRNRVVPIKKAPTDRPLSDIVTSLPNAGTPNGALEAIAMLKQHIREKLNILTSEANTARSAQQEQIRLDNQVVLSSYIIDTFDKSMMQFGDIMKDLIKSILLESPERIQELIGVEEDSLTLDDVSAAIQYINSSRVVLEESEYFTTKREKDMKKLERVAQLTGDSFSLPASVVLKIAGVSQETIDIVKESEEGRVQAEQQQAEEQTKAMQLENIQKELLVKKTQAELEKLLSESFKNMADANKKNVEANSIKGANKDNKQK